MEEEKSRLDIENKKLADDVQKQKTLRKKIEKEVLDKKHTKSNDDDFDI